MHYCKSNLSKNATNNLLDQAKQLSKAKCCDDKVVTIEVHFTAIANLALKELLQNEVEILKNDKAWIKVKRTYGEHTKRVGFLAGMITANTNLERCEKTFFQLAQIKE